MSWDDERAEDYDELEWVHRDLDLVVHAAAPMSTDHVLDVGTGTGVAAKAIAPYVQRVVGMDVSTAMLDRAECPGVEFVQGDIMTANLKDRFDVAILRMVLHHLEQPHTALGRVSDLFLEDDGRIVIVEGVPPCGCRDWYEKMFALKEERCTYSPDDLVTIISKRYDVKSVSLYQQMNMSLNNWLEKTGAKNAKSIWDMHVSAPQYVKEAYNMRLVNGDIIMDWQTCIVVGVKE